MTVARFMDLCLHDAEAGYYATRPDLGETGDFITAPLVSQIFGEILGAWVAQTWVGLGCPARFRLIELGPGLGVMLSDALRAARLAPGLMDACEVWFVETSEPLRRRQAQTLQGRAAPRWIDSLEAVPTDRPVIILANEFLDCLPILQATLTVGGWRERRVGINADGGLAFVGGEPVAERADWTGASSGAVAEWSPALADFGRTVGRLVGVASGAALFIDYGRAEPGLGDTLQALRGHRKESPLDRPGEADLTAHVDFPAFLRAAAGAGVSATAIRRQGAFLRELGARPRAAALARSRPDRAGLIFRQLDRLVSPEQMGDLFKVAAIHTPGLTPPGFEVAA